MAQKKTLLITIAGALSMVARAAPMLVSASGSLSFENVELTLSPMVHAFNWSVTAKPNPVADDFTAFKIPITDSNYLDGTLHTHETNDGGVHAAYTLTSHTTLDVNAVCLSMEIPIHSFAGNYWSTDTSTGTFPESEQDSPTFYYGKATKLLFTNSRLPNTLTLAFTFETPTLILLQDNRRWGGNTYTLRIHPPYPTPLVQNAKLEVAFTAKTHQPLHIIRDHPVTIEAQSGEWIPVEHALDCDAGSALDFSSLIPWHQPAGKFGPVKAVGDTFEFENKPGVPQRFYGVNLCFTANYLERNQAIALAERFRRIGYNTVRLHHQDDLLVESDPNKTKLNPKRIAQLDALMAAFIDNGIYVTTDLFVSRKIPWRTIGIDRDGAVPMNTFKLLCAVNEGAMENWKAFTREWLTHKNPYTQRTYAEEPALAWLSLINEGNLANFVDQQRTLPDYADTWKHWLANRQATDSAYAEIPDTIPENIYSRTPHTDVYAQFLSEIEANMAREMKHFLSETLNCKALITNSNGWSHKISDQITHHEVYDYVDDHFYIDHPRFLQKPWSLPSHCPNANPFKNSAMGMVNCAFNRMADKPFTISEFNYSGPGRYRGIGGIATGTIAALQNWSALWRFAYGHSAQALFEPKPMDYFDISTDPVMAASERAAICLFLRGDIAPLPSTLTLAIPRCYTTGIHAYGTPSVAPEWIDVAWRTRIEVAIDATPESSSNTWAFPEAYQPQAARLVRQSVANKPMGNGNVSINPKTGSFVLDTPKTVGGFAEKGQIHTSILDIDILDAPATVWLSALDDVPCKASSRLLLTHITDVQNSGIRYAEHARQTLEAWGRLPHLAACGQAMIHFAAEAAEDITVYRLSMTGKRLDRIETTIKNSRLTFLADTAGRPETATFFYEFVRKPAL